MKNHVADGKIVTIAAAPYARTPGQGLLVGALFGVTIDSCTLNGRADIATEGVFTLPKAAVTITVGEAAYWDDTAKVVTDVSSGNTLIGAFVAAAASGAATVNVRIPATAIASVAITQQTVEAALTENSTTIGGTNDGNIPSLTATAAALTENSTTIGGTQNGGFGTLTLAWNGSTHASSAEATLLIDAIRECAAMINKLVTDNEALRAAARENAVKTNALITKLTNAGVLAGS